MFKSFKGQAAAGASLLAVLAVALGIGLAQAQDDATRADDRASARAEKIKVGTYEAERVLHGYHETQKFIAYVQGLEPEARAAEEAQNFQRLMELQFDAQQRQEQLMESFNAAIDKAVPEVAREHDLKVVALELIYSHTSVEPEDITDKVIEAINEGADIPIIEPEPDPEPEPEPEAGDED